MVLALFRQGTLQFNPPPFKAQRRVAEEDGFCAGGYGKTEVRTDAKHGGKIVTKRKQACCSDTVTLCVSLLLN